MLYKQHAKFCFEFGFWKIISGACCILLDGRLLQHDPWWFQSVPVPFCKDVASCILHGKGLKTSLLLWVLGDNPKGDKRTIPHEEKCQDARPLRWGATGVWMGFSFRAANRASEFRLSDSVFLSRKAFRNVDWETAGILEILSLKQRSVSFIDKTYLAFWRMVSPVSPKQSCCIWGFLSVLLQSSVPRSIFCSCDFIFPTVKQTWTQTTEANYPTFLGWISISILRRMRMRMMTIWAGYRPPGPIFQDFPVGKWWAVACWNQQWSPPLHIRTARLALETAGDD